MQASRRGLHYTASVLKFIIATCTHDLHTEQFTLTSKYLTSQLPTYNLSVTASPPQMCGHRNRNATRLLSAQQSHRAIRSWRRVVASLFRIRRLCRIWAYLGHFLQTFPPHLRHSLCQHLTKK